MEKYICIHGHFYQPPRENAWLEDVEIQDSAYPYHDWNSRITSECYAPNATSRILDDKKFIINIVNNYSKMSFNFGPTLLSWMEKHEPDVYKAILSADRIGREKFYSGHGPAIAQGYNHIILPLANSRDKRTQIVWGIKDFTHRFGRKPAGMWMPEAAVDIETLEIMSENGITFTLLAPHQAARVRKSGQQEWQDMSGAKVDPKMPYTLKLPSGRAITVFFYDGPISQDVAFGGVLSNGEGFAGRLMSAFVEGDQPSELVNIATDGETYGHHHRFGDMALGYCLYHIEEKKLAGITIYEEYMEKFPPEYEVEILENSSWSCAHGVERWKANCGCASGGHPKWNQKWRGPLREAMDDLRDRLAHIYEELASELVRDPWEARDGYIDVVLDRTPENVEKFMTKYAVKKPSRDNKIKLLKLLECQRNAMLMYTSCGWFFDEISGIETVQILQYAARAMQLALELTGEDLESGFLEKLALAKSNLSEYKDGARIYEKLVRPCILDLKRVGVHYAMSSLFKEYPDEAEIKTYKVIKRYHEKLATDHKKISLGVVDVISNVTLEEKTVMFAALHTGGHSVICVAEEYDRPGSVPQVLKDIKTMFTREDIAGVTRLMDKHHKEQKYNLWHVFKDEQRDIISEIFDSTLIEIENIFRQTYEQHYPIMHAVELLKMPIPSYYALMLDFMLNTDIRRLIEKGTDNFGQLKKLVGEAAKWGLKLDKETIGYISSTRIDKDIQKWAGDVKDITMLGNIMSLFKALESLELKLDLWKSQNVYFFVGKRWLSAIEKRADAGEDWAKKWMKLFIELGEFLSVKVEK